MFFKRFSSAAKETQPVEPTSTQPVYILGESPLALFLAAKLTQNGNKVILLNSKAPATSYQNTEFCLKEEYNLQKNNFCIPATSRISTEPQMIIVASNLYSLKSNLSLLPGKSFPNCPLICFNYLENQDIIRSMFGSKAVQAYFKGYLEQDGTTVTAVGPLPQITISATKDEKFGTVFQNSDIKITEQSNNSINFWEHFAPFIIGYLSSVPKQHMGDLLNDRENKKQISSAINEICKLAAFEQAPLSENDLFRQLLETPRNFYFKKNRKQRTHEAAELDSYYSLLIGKARTYKCKIPQICLLIKNNYDQLLKK